MRWPSWTICGRASPTASSSPATATSAYLEAVEGAFGGDVDYAQLVKLYGNAPESMKGRYSPAECIGARKERDRRQPRSGSTSARPMPSGRTSRCGCTCAASPGSPMPSRRRSRTTSHAVALYIVVLQLRRASIRRCGDAGDGRWRDGSALDHGRRCGADRRARAPPRSAGPTSRGCAP